ncbi:hypothetical protein DSM43518_05631 [Mycobacterium marinum]|nr:hypothetical protein DSM43518_05631 [Mycobacterium marinum]
MLPAGVREEDDIVDQPPYEYLWSDLKARRNALGLWPEDLAALFGFDVTRYRSYESGGRDLQRDNRGLVDELITMEAFVAEEANRLIDGAPIEGTVVLQGVADQETFEVCYPDARNTRRSQNPYPVTLHYVAVGRAAAELRRRGRDVEVCRGERHFDLTAARCAVGLGKAETAHLLGLNVKSYFKSERGADPPRRGTLNELRALDDFIVDTAGGFEVVDHGVGVISVVEEQAEFEKLYPEARFGRSGTPYPVRTQWVAAGRLAGALAAAGRTVHVVVFD